jgi:hypothetical protein
LFCVLFCVVLFCVLFCVLCFGEFDVRGFLLCPCLRANRIPKVNHPILLRDGWWLVVALGGFCHPCWQ